METNRKKTNVYCGVIMNGERLYCEACHKAFDSSLQDDDDIWSCPICKGADCIVPACFYYDCQNPAIHGTPLDDVYVWSCDEHMP